jgi:hypothetical protein
VVHLLNLLIHFMLILAHGYLLVILLWSCCEDTLLFCKSWHNDVYNWLILACVPCEAPSFSISCISSHSSLGLCLMSSLSKEESMGTKMVELFANWVVERINLIMPI